MGYQEESYHNGTDQNGDDRGLRTSFTYNAERVIGNGSFGIVYQAMVVETNETVAIKKVFQDKRYKNRELQIMKEMRHPNIVKLKHAFYTSGDKPDELFLNVVMEYVPETVYRVMKYYNKMRQTMPMIYVKLYTYQVLRALAHIHSFGICHRDIKPQNLLVDDRNRLKLKLCDFGSAKRLYHGEPNVAYICSRYYRAPELIFGSTDYTTAIDVWSTGCVMAEMILGQPLFPGESGVDQLVEIVKVLGTPTQDELLAMNPSFAEFRFPPIKAHPWEHTFRRGTDALAISLVRKLLRFDPDARLRPLEAAVHDFFEELRQEKMHGSSAGGGSERAPWPDLFDFTKDELRNCPEHILSSLIPPWSDQQQRRGR